MEPTLRLGVSHQHPEELTPQRFHFLRQMGVQSMEVRLPAAQASYDELCRIRDLVTGEGFELFEVMPADLYDFPRAAIGAPGGGEELERFAEFVRDLGRAGITRTTYAWRTGGTYETGRAMHRDSDTRRFVLADAPTERPDGPAIDDDEVWANYRRFVQTVIPVAEQSGVLLQLHPNDPPVTHGGIARIFRSTEAYRRAIAFAEGSPASGILFCVGTWAEMSGPDGRGENIDAAIREFVAGGRVQQIHFRNVSATLPEFHETYPDAGYLDMPAIVRLLRETGFSGMIVPDHVPVPIDTADGRTLAEAYSFGYIRALIQDGERGT